MMGKETYQTEEGGKFVKVPEAPVHVEVDKRNDAIHIDYVDPVKNKSLQCEINAENPEGIGDVEACRVLRQALSTTKQALQQR